MQEPTPHQVAVFDALVEVARPIILTRFTPDSCIASTRIGLDVLAYFGIQAREIPLLVAVFNDEATAMIGRGMDIMEVHAETQKHTTEQAGGPWSLALGAPTGRPGGWAGHLVIGVPSVGVVIDLSADQATRPHKNIHLAPHWTRIPAEAWWQDPTQVYVSVQGGMAMAWDRRAVDATGYRSSGNWHRKVGGRSDGVYKDLTGQIIRQMKDRLGD